MPEEQPQDAPPPATPPPPPEHGALGHHHARPELPPFRIFEELKNRNVGRVAILYLVVGYVVLEVFEMFFHLLELPAWTGRAAVLLMVIGFPAATASLCRSSRLRPTIRRTNSLVFVSAVR